MSLAAVAAKTMDKLGYDRMKRSAKLDKIFDAILLEVEAVAYELARTSATHKVTAPTARMVPMYEAFVDLGMAKKTPASRYHKGTAVPGFEFVYYRGPGLTGKVLHFVMQSKEAEEGAELLSQLRVHAPTGYFTQLEQMRNSRR